MGVEEEREREREIKREQEGERERRRRITQTLNVLLHFPGTNDSMFPEKKRTNVLFSLSLSRSLFPQRHTCAHRV